MQIFVQASKENCQIKIDDQVQWGILETLSKHSNSLQQLQ